MRRFFSVAALQLGLVYINDIVLGGLGFWIKRFECQHNACDIFLFLARKRMRALCLVETSAMIWKGFLSLFDALAVLKAVDFDV